jgi:glycosyltransferase involved in cell wall biosynthesis
MKNLAIDLRGLNYKHQNGISTYTINLLRSLSVLKKTNEFKLHAIGLKESVLEELCKEHPFVKSLFDKQVSSTNYCNFFKLPNPVLTLIFLLKLVFTKNLNYSGCYQFDYIILPQPKILLFNRQTKLITVYHDLYGIKNYNSTTFRQQLVENIITYKSLAKRSVFVIANSISTAKDVQKTLGISTKKIKLLYPFFRKNTQKDKKNKPIPHSNFYLAISGIEPRKNWENLILAHDYYQKKYNKKLELILLGRIVNKKYFNLLQKLIKQNNIKGVHFLINPTNSVKHSYLRNAKFCVYPSFWEGFGYPILESFYHNKPIITSNISSMPELGKDSAVYVNPINSKEIATAIHLLYTDKKYYKLLQKNCQKNLKNFSREETLNFFQKHLFST